MELHVLGPVEVTVDGVPVAIKGAKVRALLAMLVLHANQLVPADRVTDALWPHLPADRAAANLHVRLSELRAALRAAGEPDRLVTRAPGYVLRVEPGELDADRFETALESGRRALAAGNAPIALAGADQALALWHGPPFAAVADQPFVRAEAARLDELHLAAAELRSDAALACGRHAEVLAELDSLVAAHPLRERLWGLRMLALYRSGRQAESLRAYQDLRTALVSELGIEPSGELRELERRILRQDPGLLAGDPGAPLRPAGERPDVPTRYVESGGVHIAYRVIGEPGAGPGDGPAGASRDIVFVPGLISHLDRWFDDAATVRFFSGFRRLGRLIMFDKRDTGLSDRAPGAQSPDQRMEDIRAVMDAAGSRRAVLFSYSEGGAMSLLFAATHPERVAGLVLVGAAARWSSAPDYPCGRQSDAMLDALEHIGRHEWGRGTSLAWYAPSRAGSDRARDRFARWERMSSSPSAFRRMLDMVRHLDVRHVLPSVTVPTLVVQRRNDRISPPCHGRYLAERLPDARYVEQDGDHLLWVGDSEALLDEIVAFVRALPA